MVSNSRMAARAVTRRYDAYLRPLGLTSTQLSLMHALRTTPGRTVSELAEAGGFDRTTLTRNLDRLEQMGLVASHAQQRGNGRICELTAKAESQLGDLLPLWRRAQAEMKAELGEARFGDTIAALQRLATV